MTNERDYGDQTTSFYNVVAESNVLLHKND